MKALLDALSTIFEGVEFIAQGLSNFIMWVPASFRVFWASSGFVPIAFLVPASIIIVIYLIKTITGGDNS